MPKPYIVPTLIHRVQRFRQRYGYQPPYVSTTTLEAKELFVWLGWDPGLLDSMPKNELLTHIQVCGAPLKIDDTYVDPAEHDWLLHAPVEEWLKLAPKEKS